MSYKNIKQTVLELNNNRLDWNNYFMSIAFLTSGTGLL